jgi:hypothetical protein
MGKCDVSNTKAQLIMLDSRIHAPLHLRDIICIIEQFVIVDCNCQQIHSFPKHMLCSPFFLLAKVLPKREKKIQIFENEVRDWRSSISERKKTLKNHQIPIVGSQCVAINIKC